MRNAKFTVRRPGRLLAGAAMLILATGGGAFWFGTFNQNAKAASGAEAAAPPPATVRVAEAISTKLAPHSEAPGSVVSVNDSLIAAATAGKILWVAEVGTELKEGDVIARIDPADATLQRDDARADVKRLTTRSAYLARLVQRYEGLGEDGGESETTLDQMRADRDEADQNLERARVALRRAETALERTEVKAPFNGRLAARELEIGEFAALGSAVARLVNTDELEVTARAPDAMLATVHSNDEIAVSNGTQTINARVRAVVPVGDTVSRTLELRLALPKTDWHIGSAVQVRLPRTVPKKVVAVHRDALILRSNRTSVFKIADDNVARQIDVELGAADGDYIEVIGDVDAGDRIVTRGGERLRDGQTVVIQDAAGGAMS